MTQCPKCATALMEDYGMVTCPGCGSFLFIDMEGVAQIGQAEAAQEDEPSPAVAEPTPPAFFESSDEAADPAATETPFSMFPETAFETNPNLSDPSGAAAIERNPFLFNASEPAEPEASPATDPIPAPWETPAEPTADPVVEEAQAPAGDDFSMDNFLGLGEAVPAETSSIDSGALSPDDPLGLNEFANSELSQAKDGLLMYRVTVSGIDSKEIRESIREAIEDQRFAWDASRIMASISKGVLRLDQLAPVKASIFVSRIKRLPVKIHWEQYAITQSEPEAGSEYSE